MPFTFRPRLIDSLVGYNSTRLMADLGAGATVAVVALPLAMAFAIASGLKPEAGIITTIIAGFLVALLGGSRVQIGGPAGAFIVIVYGIVQQYGVANLVIATTLSGLMLLAMGLLRVGSLVRFIPMSVIIGFTNGIAVLIALSQIKDFLGLAIADMPADFFGIMGALWQHRSGIDPWTTALALFSLAVLVLWQHGLPRLARRAEASSRKLMHLSRVPGSIVVLVLATAGVAALGLPVETIGSRFGGIPSTLPAFALPAFNWESARFMLMPAVTLALLGAIESLLCARVADGMIGDRHDPNQELMAQGVANFVAPLFGGMPATGTIARTVTNAKAGATSPVAGMFHAVVLLAVVLVAAPLAGSIPLAALAAILMFVAWNMGQWREFSRLRQLTMPYRITLLSVFFLTVVFDLTVAVQFGILAACITFIYRMSRLSVARLVERPELAGHTDQVRAWELSGVIFFGSTAMLDSLQHGLLPSRALVLDLRQVIYMDSSGADALTNLAQHCHAHGVRLLVSRLHGQPLDMARRSGWLAQPGLENWPDLATAVASALPTDDTNQGTGQPTEPVSPPGHPPTPA